MACSLKEYSLLILAIQQFLAGATENGGEKLWIRTVNPVFIVIILAIGAYITITFSLDDLAIWASKLIVSLFPMFYLISCVAYRCSKRAGIAQTDVQEDDRIFMEMHMRASASAMWIYYHS